MKLNSFLQTLDANTPPIELSDYLQSLWWDKKGDWEKSHEIIQYLGDKNAAWIHAYLHRKEGDIWNADYWYSRAGKTRPQCTLEEEWTLITEAMI